MTAAKPKRKYVKKSPYWETISNPPKSKIERKHLKVPRINLFWFLGIVSAILIYHSYGILSGVYQDLNILPYDYAILLGVLEAIIAPFLGLWFLWRLFIWTHDHSPALPKNVFDDPRLLD